MTDEQVLEIVAQYDKILAVKTAAIERNFSDPNYAHLRWMCSQIPAFIADKRIPKAMRWLGFLQGAMWWAGARTVEEMKKDNMPLTEVFDANKV